ncbi:MAG: hypothetical protein K2I78_02445, partial [Clostridia bacterium]|nr:hypothetical protein [Clostridia bacterium]
MESQVNENSQNGVNEIKDKRKGYNKKLSAKFYKRFTLMTFIVYYLNCMVRIITRCVSFYNSKGISGFAQWWEYGSDVANWKEVLDWVFDWYTIALVTFLLLYAIVFLFTFIRFSPKNKKTFKYFKKGFLIARRLIKMINLGLSITVLINSAQLLTFADKLLFIISLSSLVITFIQLCVSVATWIISRRFSKNNTSIKAYMGKMGNVVSNYVATTRVRPDEMSRSGDKVSLGEKLGSMRSRFLHTVEALTFSEDEARESDRQYSGELLSPALTNTDRFENDYVETQTEQEQENAAKTTSTKRRHASRLKSKTEKTKDSKSRTKIKDRSARSEETSEGSVKRKRSVKKPTDSKKDKAAKKSKSSKDDVKVE